MQEKMMERRQFRRTPKSIRITWQNQDIRFNGITSDICPGGIFVVTGQSVPSETVLDVELWFNGSPPVHCRGKVVWVNRGEVVSYPAGFGMQFLAISEDSLEHVLRICEEAC